jgi:anti-sigma regulatory factor (Ser/Thr protein kinase)
LPPDATGASGPAATLALQLPNDAAALEPARRALLEFLAPHAPSVQAVYTLELVLEEVLTNQIKYANADAAGPQNSLTVTLEPGVALLQFEDSGVAFELQQRHARLERHRQRILRASGVAFDPLQASDPKLPSSIDEARVGGLGLMLVRHFAKSAHYERVDGRNRLCIGVALA